METNKGDADLTQLVLFDPATGKMELVESDPLKRVDFGGAIFSEVTDELVVTAYARRTDRLYFKDKAYGSRLRLAGSEAARARRSPSVAHRATSSDG